LRDEAAHYPLHVLRLKPGQAVRVFDGNGGEYPAQVLESGKKSLTLALGGHEASERESPLRLVLVQGISRNEHMDYTVQKAVELGVSEIVPAICERTQHHAGERLEKRHKHWAGIIRAACEQCGRNRLPRLHPPLLLADWLAWPAQGPRLFLSPAGQASAFGPSTGSGNGSVALLIGPEGGFSSAEEALILEAGCQPARLGPRILRTETAALAAIALCQHGWGDLN